VIDRARGALQRFALGAFVVGLAVSISLSEVSLVVLLVTVVWPSRERPPVRLPLIVPIGGFAVWTIVSALASARPSESLLAAKTLLTLGTFYVVLHALRDRGDASRLADLLFVLTAAVAALSIVQVAACPAAPPDVPVLRQFLRRCDRAHGFYSIYMTLAGVLTLVLLSALPRIARSSRALAFGGPAWLVGALALALTYVRGAWLGFAAGAVGSMLAWRRRSFAVAVLAVAIVALALVLPGVMKRVRSIGDPSDPTARDRLAMLHGGLRMAGDHPWLGTGVGQVKVLYPAYAPPDARRRSTSHLHDTPLQILVERGAVGLALWLAIFAEFFVRASRVLSRLAPTETGDRALVLGVLAAVGGFLIAGLFEYNFGDTEVLLVACTLMALPFVIDRDRDLAV